LILHGTGGSGEGFLRETFGGELFGKGRLLDAEKYFLVVPDNLGHGRSSKPSDGLRRKFPRYGYRDLVTLQKRLLTEHLGVDHLRLVMGTSMGGMHCWMWGVEYPEMADALFPLASLPVEIAGRNLIWRRMAIEAIESDPAYQNGEYKKQPPSILWTSDLLTLIGANVLDWHSRGGTREKALAMRAEQVRLRNGRKEDANDRVYHLDASRDYNPAPGLEKIRAALTAVNFADDPINPAELGILEREMRRVKNGKAVIVPGSAETRGHGTHSLPRFWSQYLAELLERSEGR
jgi:homoserine O-acetyltransferase/O-succinyltransferase